MCGYWEKSSETQRVIGPRITDIRTKSKDRDTLLMKLERPSNCVQHIFVSNSVIFRLSDLPLITRLIRVSEKSLQDTRKALMKNYYYEGAKLSS